MNDRAGRPSWLSPIIHLSNNVVSLIGVIMTTTGGVAWLFLIPVYLGEGTQHPYMGIIFYMLVPGFFFTGLALIPLGIWLRNRKESADERDPKRLPPVNWENADFRRLVYFVAIATAINVIIGGHLTMAGVEYVDSNTFCGLTCHTVMIPEYTAYQDSPHFRVHCTECHIGAGASWFVKSKLSGVRQVFATALDTYSKPIPTPIHNLRPARETCEQCHWPQKFTGTRLVVNAHFSDDEQSSMSKTVLLMHIGGGGADRGIHGFHLDPGVVVQYRSNPERTEIPWVSYTGTDGVTTEYAAEGWDPAQAESYELRTMDCLDCHNRPSHAFELPERALDRALARGRIDPTLPMIKSAGLEILNAEYAPEQAALQIPARVESFYREKYPELVGDRLEDVRLAGEQLLRIYQRNVFPEMNVTWGAYPNWLGHNDFPGCFRCHDDLHESSAGTTISQDCSSCHELLAIEEEDPAILAELGVN